TCIVSSSVLPAPAAGGAAAGIASSLARGIRQLDAQPTAVQLLAVQVAHGGLGRLEAVHLDEAEAARLPRGTIRYNGGRLDTIDGGQKLPQPLSRRRERQPTDEELLSHDDTSSAILCEELVYQRRRGRRDQHDGRQRRDAIRAH